MEPSDDPHPSSSCSTYAFISHSQESLPLNGQSNAEYATSGARRRRRRTSPKDQAILEEEYRKCDRPDKARRREITKLVHMGEKEVQIWFCNKRQAQRRRATPLLPHEMIPNSSRSSHFNSSQTSLEARGEFTSSPGSVGLGLASDSVSFANGSSSPGGPASRPTGEEGHDSRDRDPDDDDDSSHPQRFHHHHLAPSQYAERVNLPEEELTPKPSQTPMAIASTPNAITTPSSEMAHHRLQDVLNSTPVAPPASSQQQPPPPLASSPPRRTKLAEHSLPPPTLLKRSSSIRLSTSLEGKAILLDESEPAITSSPPLPATRPTPRPKRRHNLGPVDSKLFEFCCDNQSAIRSPARTPPQPPEANQAIRLLRSKSFSLPSLPRVPSLRRTTTHDLPPSHTPKKRKLAALSSSANKQPTLGRSTSLYAKTNSKGEFRVFESVESDKENRPPGAPVSPPPEPRKRAPTSNPAGRGPAAKLRRVLSEAKYHAESEDHDAWPPASQESGYGAGGGSQDSVGAFMRRMSGSQESAESPPRRKDEIECVENLLSLRGGSWR